MNSEYKNEDKKINILITCAILTLIAAITGATYAYFSITTTSSDYIYGETGFENMELYIAGINAEGNEIVEEEEVETEKARKLMPQVDSGIQSAVSGVSGNGMCRDANNNTVCKVYSITVTNMASVQITISGTLELKANYITGIEDSMPNLKWALGTSTTTGFPLGGAYYTKDNTDLGTTILEPKGTEGSSKTYYIVIWISETGGSQTDNGKFTGTVSFSGYMTDGEGNNLQGITSTFTG